MATELQWRHYPTDDTGFLRSPVLLYGAKDAILIDGGFTLSNGRAIVADIQALGKNLTTVYVSVSDPDFYFSLEVFKQAFPSAKIQAAKATIDGINANVHKKLQVWGPKLGDNGPTEKSVVIPEPFDEPSLELEGHKIDIVHIHGMHNRRYVWVPSLKAVVGGVLLFAGLHVWTADTPTVEDRAAWLKALDSIEARNPKVVVAGHVAPGSACDVSAVHHTRHYLQAFDEEVVKSKDGAALIEAMKKRYPNAGLAVALDIGAKVVKGEMKWG